MPSGEEARLEFSLRLRKWRLQMAVKSGKRYSQEQAARHLKVNLDSYRKWEQGCVLPRAHVAMELDAMMRAMGI